MLEKVSQGFCGHHCAVLPLYRQVFLVSSSVLYCADIFTDIYVAIETLVRNQDPDLGAMMLFFVVVPLMYGNYISQSNRFGRIRFVSPTQNVFTLDKGRLNGRPFLRTLAPYTWDSPIHVLFNLLCFFQMGVLIDVMEMLSHRNQPIPSIGQQYSHYCYIRRLEVMLENCPQLIFQVCGLMKDEGWLIRTIGPAGGVDPPEDVSFSDVIRLISIIFTIVALPLALCADEEAGRYCDKVSFDLVREVRLISWLPPVNLQLSALYLGFLLTIVSRTTLVALFYVFCLVRNMKLNPTAIEEFPNLITPLCVEAHHLVIFVIYLIQQRLAERNQSVIVIEKLGRFNMLISFFFFSFSEVFLILLQFPKRYRRAIRTQSKEKDQGDQRYRTFYLLYLFNLVEFIALIVVFHKSDILNGLIADDANTQSDSSKKEKLDQINSVLTQDRMKRTAYFSLACYLFAAVFFMFYHSPLLHPDSLKERAVYKTADQVRLYGRTPYCASSINPCCVKSQTAKEEVALLEKSASSDNGKNESNI